MPGKIHIGEQICLRPTTEQLNIIQEACKLCGYPPNGEGVLRLLMDQLLLDMEDEEEKDQPPTGTLSQIVQYYKDNPKELSRTLEFGKSLFRGLIRK